ncbi:MAG TPA: hypothetical protein ENJ84_04680 [Gammaproteobacteria bacterium]|nr:hypothetical protein [Gammaproteobacteria bacterium]
MPTNRLDDIQIHIVIDGFEVHTPLGTSLLDESTSIFWANIELSTGAEGLSPGQHRALLLIEGIDDIESYTLNNALSYSFTVLKD